MRLKFGTSGFRFGTLALFVATLALTGGTYRLDVPQLIPLRLMAALVLVALLLDHRAWDWRPVRAPVMLLALFAGITAIQLIPLPPSLWLALPGRAAYAEAAAAAGLAQPWRPISLTPDLTINALLSLVPAAVILTAFAGLSEKHRIATVLLPAALVVLSALLAMVQLVGGGESPAYLYGFLSDNLPVGLLTNRNHQAALLTTMIPMLACGAILFRKDGRGSVAVTISAVAAAVAIVPLVLLTGSRFGLLGLAMAVAGAAWILLTSTPAQRRKPPPKWAMGAIAAAGIGIVAASIWAGRAASVDRIFSEPQSERRLESLPTLLDMLWKNQPFGTGMGSFDTVFRVYEPDRLLYDSYFNHAHNDVLELAITGGAPAVLLLVLAVIWFFRSGWIVARMNDAQPASVIGKLGLVTVLILSIASLFDYPLRAPLMGGVFALGWAWIAWAKHHAANGRA